MVVTFGATLATGGLFRVFCAFIAIEPTNRKKKESHALNIIQERVELIKHGDFSGKFDIKIDEIGATAILNIPIV